MNPDDMRGLFNEALAGADPVPASSTDDIVTAGRRRVLRRRAAIGTGAVAGLAALAAAVAIPMGLAGGAAPIDTAGPGTREEEAEAPDVNTCEAPADQSDEQLAIAAIYDQALETAMTAIGASLGGYCGEGEPEYGGFSFDAEAGGYRYEAFAIFSDSGEHAILRVEVLEPNENPGAERMEGLAGCGGADVECTWDEPEDTEPLLLVEETRTVVVDAEENPEGDQVPVQAALLELDDRVIVHVELEEALRTGTLSTTPQQLADIARAIPVGQEASETEEDGIESYTLPDDAALAEALVDGIAEQFPGATVPPATEVEFAGQEQTEAYEEGYRYGNDNTRIAYADATVNEQQVRFFLQVTPLESPGDGGASQGPAEHYANCDYFECDYSQLNDSTGLVHRTSVDVRPGPTSIEHRAADGWVVGVGAESLGTTEPPSIGFEALDKIVNAIR
ncbi:hypothetical protein O1R50_03360 [Glycomyces luteolus]|uniref:Uncharacterized protein n=1 Tax=Glycomyces luteolus TaxID=2670330 RepID=A0A9X3P820_9ACTN|nr:hypothetical protein [Glycomyces luteolus]MDA1358643.1 hypothetical protein [Glycomyces luteolus]